MYPMQYISPTLLLQQRQLQQNANYINGLLDNLTTALDKWIVSGNLATRMRAYNIMKQIERESMDQDLVDRSKRMVSRASMPLEEPPQPKQTYNTPPPTYRAEPSSPSKPSHANYDDMENAYSDVRNEFAAARTNWEENRSKSETNVSPGPAVAKSVSERVGRSALSNRASSNSKPDLMMSGVDKGLDPFTFSKDKQNLQNELSANQFKQDEEFKTIEEEENEEAIAAASALTSELVARAGAGDAFEGENLGIGGLDDVLARVKRRIWVPLAAPPSLLRELGINPVRGLLLYGMPGCGKTLLARTLGKILSPARPITVVSGPEIMDKFVGSSEANLREIFDNPPEIYGSYANQMMDGGKALSKAALHVIVLDEFDAMARARGGSGGKGEQGDAGVARDSVVNQLLAKMDGVDGLGVPTLVIGLTNKRTLIEPALMRPGRFEVQVEVPPPRTVAQRVSILKVHMGHMFRAGRVLVRDAPDGTAAALRLERTGHKDIPSYEELLDLLAIECDGMSGASLAGVTRAAASRALERAVCDFAGSIAGDGEPMEGGSIADCLVTKEDFEKAIEDVFESSRGGDGGEEEKDEEENEQSKEVDGTESSVNGVNGDASNNEV